MLELIKELQWIDIREYDQEMIKRNLFCPACGAAKAIGHHPWCKIKKAIEDVELCYRNTGSAMTANR